MSRTGVHSRKSAERPAGSARSKGYVPALDGIRAFAILAVMVGHLGGAHLLYAGGLGVDVFFVLSGFLITSLIIGERVRRGSFSFGNFYARRALRLLPALFAAIALAWAICTVDSKQPWVHQTIHNLVWVVFYGANWVRAGGHNIGLLGQTWSLSVEEQYYLVWPAVTLLLVARGRDLRRSATLLAGLAAGVAVYRVAVLELGWNPFSVSNRTDTHCDGLLLGAALAFWLASRPTMPRRSVMSITVLSGALGLLAFMEFAHSVYLIEEAGYVLAAVVTAAIIAGEVGYGRSPLHPLLSWPPARWVGRRSYVLYLVHFPIFIEVGVGDTRYAHWCLAMVLSFAAAEVCHLVVEAPALRIKRRFERTEAGLALRSPVLAR